MTQDPIDPRASLTMVPCPYCDGRSYGLLTRLLRPLVGRLRCEPCGGFGVIPAIVHEAWIRGECGAEEWAQYHAACRPSR